MNGAKVIDFSKATGRGDFFIEVNRLALGAIDKWFPTIFPTARPQSGTGAWRVSSADLGRNLEEDLSMHPTEGGTDWGLRKSCSPIDVVVHWGGTADAAQAALWLCEKIGADPVALGWKGKPKREQKKQPSNGTTVPVSRQGREARSLYIGSDVEIAGCVVQDLADQFGEIVSCDGSLWRYVSTHWEAILNEALWLTVQAYDGTQFLTQSGTFSVERYVLCGEAEQEQGRVHPGLHETRHHPAGLLRRGRR